MPRKAEFLPGVLSSRLPFNQCYYCPQGTPHPAQLDLLFIRISGPEDLTTFTEQLTSSGWKVTHPQLGPTPQFLFVASCDKGRGKLIELQQALQSDLDIPRLEETRNN